MDKQTLCGVLSIMKKKSVQTDTNMSFAELTTFGVGGKIKLVLRPDTVRKFVWVIRYLDKRKIPYVVLGKGSNVLASDEPYDGAVVSTIALNKISLRGRSVKAQAGVSTVTLGKLLQDEGLSGGEFLSCLPASVGGAVVMNAGCYGQDVKSVIVSVKALRSGKIINLSADKCGFCKRGSVFKGDGGFAIISATFRFVKSTPDKVSAAVRGMRQKKAATQPLNYRSAGCVLYHDKAIVSKLIDEAGLKGFRIGGAEISEKHAGFVVNVDKAESKDIYLVIRRAQKTLSERFGVNAKLEVRLVNFTEDDL